MFASPNARSTGETDMTTFWQRTTTLLILVVSTVFLIPTAAAQSDGSRSVQDELVTIGSRRAKPRSVVDSPVPVDVISGEDFTALGNSADLTDNLKTLVPSYTATPATGDGSAFVRPTSLRGTSPDQVLILVNGKRRHRSALVQFFAPAAGNGAHGVDIGMIPSIAIERVEVLRDGAASQYGSDAIAGVINFVMKEDTEGGDVKLQYGEFYDGENSVNLGANAGFGIGSNGFVNLSLEFANNDGLSRGIQRADAQALIDMGVSETGQDAVFGDAPLAQSWGRPETEALRFFFNSGYNVNDDMKVYLQAGYGDTEGRYRFFYRNSTHPTILDLQAIDPTFNGLPGGYTPFLDGDQEDISGVLGVKGAWDNEMTYDFSIGYGMNELDYFLNNTINQSLGFDALGNIAQRGFDVGAYEQEELNLNADFSYPIRDNLNLGFGLEWREETFTIIAGEPNSYTGNGSNGFTGTRPESAGEFDRDNWAVYADLEHDISDKLLLQYALRFEDFSDFGSTANGKIAARYSVTDTFAIRGAVSTGFHAPTPGQSNVEGIITTFDGVSGLQQLEGLIRPTSPLAVANGGKPLQEEESLNISLGFTTDIGDRTNITVDVYQIEVDDRIYRTGDIAVTDPMSPFDSIAFYTNALDVEHTGVDVVLTSDIPWNDNVNTAVSLGFSYNDVEVTGQSTTGTIAPVSVATIEDIENNYPNERFVLTTNTFFTEKFNLLARINYYGEHYDERGTINDPVEPSAEIDALFFVDLELGYRFNDNFRLALGGSNIFDEFPDEIGSANANRLSVGLQYPRRSAANYEGGSYYLRGEFSF